MRKFLGKLLVLIPLLTLSACLIPVEEVYVPLPTVDESVKSIVSTAVCTREDLQDTVRLEVRYVPVRTEELSFPEDNVPYGDVFVMAGDSVEEGDLLIKLDTEALDEQYNAVAQSIAENETALEQLEAETDLARRRQAILNQSLSWQEKNDANERIEKNYTLQKQSLEDNRYLLTLRLNDLHERIEARKIYAPFSGIVTFIYSPERTELSQHTRRIAVVADSSQSIFRGETQYYELFHPGDEYIVSANNTEYPATVVSEEELGLKKQEPVPGKRLYVYLRLNETVYDMKDSTRGLLYVVRAESKNTLTVPIRAVTEINGESYVYCPSENGIRTNRRVETGLSNNSRIEILSGLSEGDIVITN